MILAGHALISHSVPVFNISNYFNMQYLQWPLVVSPVLLFVVGLLGRSGYSNKKFFSSVIRMKKSYVKSTVQLYCFLCLLGGELIIHGKLCVYCLKSTTALLGLLPF